MTGYMCILEDDIRSLSCQFIDYLGYRLSFPGIGFELKMIVSPGMIVTFLCTSAAIRDRAAIDSPWLPVVIRTVFSGG